MSLISNLADEKRREWERRKKTGMNINKRFSGYRTFFMKNVSFKKVEN